MQRADELLMKSYQEGDTMALQELFVRYKARIIYYCIGIVGNRADAEDVAGDVFVAVVRHKMNYDATRTFSTWLYTIAHNTCVSRLRRKSKTLSFWFHSGDDDRDTAWEPADTAPHARDQLHQREVSERIRRAIQGLPLEQKEALLLKQYQGCSYEEISHILDCSLEKVKILIFRAKERLRVALAYLIKEGSR